MSVSSGKPSPTEQVEEWLGCKKGALAGAFSSPGRQEINRFHKAVQTNQAHARVMTSIAVGGLVVSAPSALAGLFISSTPPGRDFAGPDLTLMCGMFVMPVLGGLMLTYGAQYVRKYLEQDTRREMDEFRAKLPKHVLK